MTQWYYTNGRSKHGPIDEAGIRLRAQKGYVRRDTLLWRSGLAGWTRADELGFFPDDDVEPTLCAIPVPDGPPPIPQMQQTAAMPPMQPVAPQPPMAALPPPQPPYRAASVPVAP
ncbi:MAG: DUF4339 domain-containing protein, partial [Kiritimatiellae bacterium]|nr:DUF4339 domain-containing protein [Kiritimatiellia bacterium]